ncbi:unnamed protein product [Durusdinium trenchii]|uniref:Uncharacterized protein n=1 Tax=Durusdinium trenchii TaxID=1381693 RepID=A0ABP0P2W1_9DINO
MARHCCLVFLLIATQAHKVQRNVALRGGGVHDHQLRVCNAYAYEAAVDILVGEDKLTKDKPLPYRQCHDFQVLLQANDRLDFRIGNATTGTFSVSELPPTDALLLLVVFRHDVESTAVSFESHVFIPAKTPQVAIIDTFLGTSDFKPVIWDGNQTEKLRFGRVISVNPGKYTIQLQNEENETEDAVSMETRPGENYVALRIGARVQHGPSFREELITFPQAKADMFGRSTAFMAVASKEEKEVHFRSRASPRLRVCHAFPSDEPMSVAWRDMVLTGDQPLTYKTCRDLQAAALKVGEELHIGLRNGPSNTFQISDFPEGEPEGTLLLVCFRRGRSTLDLEFHSHAFAPTRNSSAQMGPVKSEMSELHVGRAGEVNAGGGETVSFDSIVTVNPGDYKLWLVEDSKTKDEVGFEVEALSSYVVLRVGGEAHESSGNKEFPQELVVFPYTELSSDIFHRHRSSASSMAVPLLALLALWAM